MPTSPDTLLRRVKPLEGVSRPVPRFVGIDDWAWRKGQRYGTILFSLILRLRTSFAILKSPASVLKTPNAAEPQPKRMLITA
jgi:hypothetical protein